jgi:hypothetical protein
MPILKTGMPGIFNTGNETDNPFIHIFLSWRMYQIRFFEDMGNHYALIV